MFTQNEDAVHTYYINVSRRLREAIELSTFTQEEIAAKCQALGVKVTQEIISRIINYEEAWTRKKSQQSGDEKKRMRTPSISLIYVVCLCQVLEIDVQSVVRMTKEVDIATSDLMKKAAGAAALSTDVLDPAFSGYIGEYYCYFFSTREQEYRLLESSLTFKRNPVTGLCDAELLLNTERKSKHTQRNVLRSYFGSLIISPSQKACYCFLENVTIGKMSVLVFNHQQFLNDACLQYVLSSAMTISADMHSPQPTMHKALISHRKLSTEELQSIQPMLFMDTDTILIPETRLNRLKQFLPRDFCDLLGEDAEIKPEKYYSINTNQIPISYFANNDDMLQTLNLLHLHSTGKINNKITPSDSRWITNYLASQEEA